jgi:hypothetical protein
MRFYRVSLTFLLAIVFLPTAALAKEVVEANKDGVRLVLGSSTIPEIIGEWVPFSVIFEKAPLKAGDNLLIFADTRLAYVISPIGDGFLLREFSGRVRMNQGALEALVNRRDGEPTKLAQRISIDRPFAIPEDGPAISEFKARATGNTIQLIHRNRMARTNYVEHMAIVVPTGMLAISMTPYSSGLAFYRIVADHSLENPSIDLRLATKPFNLER